MEAILLRDCRECALQVYDNTPPNTRYAESVARLLFGTAATESNFRYRRQTVFDWTRNVGAWGLYQTEQGSVEAGMRMLSSRPALGANAARFLFQQRDADITPIVKQDSATLLRLISGWDRLGCLFARLHYLRCAGAIPETLDGQARYWKQFYNTVAGKGTVTKYLADWERLAAQTVEGVLK